MGFSANLPDYLTIGADGFIRFTGHRVGYHHVINRFNEGGSAESVWEEFPTLSLATIYKVIAFHLENSVESNAYVVQCHDAALRQAAERKATPNLADLRQRLATKQAAGVS